MGPKQSDKNTMEAPHPEEYDIVVHLAPWHCLWDASSRLSRLLAEGTCMSDAARKLYDTLAPSLKRQFLPLR